MRQSNRICSQQISCMDEAVLDDVQSVSLVNSTEHDHDLQIADSQLGKYATKVRWSRSYNKMNFRLHAFCYIIITYFKLL